MIKYETGGIQFLLNIGRWDGSVFPKACIASIPNAIISAFFVVLLDPEWFRPAPAAYFQPQEENILNNNAIWGGFSFLIGFLVVFRTQQAYSRFWEGCTQMHKMGAEWFDACSSLCAFCKHTTVEQERVLCFQNTLVRLFSMLHAAALGQIEDTGSEDYLEIAAFNLELIDPASIDPQSMEEIRSCHAKVELVFQWIQQLIVENITPGVLSIPPPILSRSFQEIANGMVHFHEAMKISLVPFPFPYAQTCDALLVIHWILVPFMVTQWVTKPWWAAVFSFIQVFTFWCLNIIALELENPFGHDANDIDGSTMQVEMNERLRLLLRSSTKRTPYLVQRAPLGCKPSEAPLEMQQGLVRLALELHPDEPLDGPTNRSTTRSIRAPTRNSASYTMVWHSIDELRKAERLALIPEEKDEGAAAKDGTIHVVASHKGHGTSSRGSYVVADEDKEPSDPPAELVAVVADILKPAADAIAKDIARLPAAYHPPDRGIVANNSHQDQLDPQSPRRPPDKEASGASGGSGVGIPYRRAEPVNMATRLGPRLTPGSSPSKSQGSEHNQTDGVLDDRLGEILDGVDDDVADIYEIGIEEERNRSVSTDRPPDTQLV